MRKRIESGIGRRIIRLSGRAHVRTNRAEQYETIQLEIVSKTIQINRAIYLGGPHSIPLFIFQVLKEPVADNTRRMKYASERSSGSPAVIDQITDAIFG
jgi:hypothetical protein